MPRQEQDGRMGAVSAKAAGALPVGGAAHAVPGLVGHAMDASNLVVGRRLGLILALEALEPQDQQVEQVGVVPLQVAQLPAEGHRAWSGGEVLVK